MKLKTAISRILAGFAIFIASHTFANTQIVGGVVPSIHNTLVTPIENADNRDEQLGKEIALIQIENNLPDFQLVLDFSGAQENGNQIEDVILESVSGILGGGLVAPQKMVLSHELGTSKYIWNPGTQTSATLGYVVKVSVTYKKPPTVALVMGVSMPTSL